MSRIQDATVLITGGAAGIGKLMGEDCLQRGAKTLIIFDLDAVALSEQVDALTAQGYRVYAEVLDITDTPAVEAAAQRVLAQCGPVDILINNAGIIIGKNFIDHTASDIDRTLAVNTQAMMHLTSAFLPAMIGQGRGHIVNIASAAGMAANPQMSVYVASKWAVIGWSETLRLELEQLSRHLHVTTVTPFYISTGMFEGVRSPIVPILKPEKAARTILNDVERNRIYSRMPWIVFAMPFFKGILPQRWYDAVIGKWFGIHRSMHRFRGKNRESGPENT